MTRDAPAACADGRSNGHLTFAAGRAGEKQAGNIRAGDQEDESYGAEQDQQNRTEFAGNLLAQRHDVDSPVSVKIGILVFELGGDGIHLGLRLGIVGTRFEARGHGKEAANLLAIVKGLRKHEGRPQAGLCAGEGAVLDEPIEILGRDADDGPGFSIEKNGFANNGGIAGEAILPKAVT